LLASVAGIKLTHVPYKGTGPAIGDLLGGHVSMTFSSLPPTLGLARDGKAHPLAITSATRSRLLPDVPTRGRDAAGPRIGAALRHGGAGEDAARIMGRLNAALSEALASEDVIARITTKAPSRRRARRTNTPPPSWLTRRNGRRSFARSG
jgi:tripartite-type tricarboxylate transporter receptor subunit TctC